MEDLSKFDKALQELGWDGTAEELFQTLQGGAYDQRICSWVHQIGQEMRKKDEARGRSEGNEEEMRKELERAISDFAKEYPERMAQLDQDVLLQYGECAIAGYHGKPVPSEGTPWYVWLGLAAAALGVGWVVTRK